MFYSFVDLISNYMSKIRKTRSIYSKENESNRFNLEKLLCCKNETFFQD